MNFEINIQDIIKDPMIEHSICSFASTKKGKGSLNLLVNVLTKEVTFKVVGNTGKTITNDLAEAVTLYNLIGL